jgi:hypothetical protein
MIGGSTGAAGSADACAPEALPEVEVCGPEGFPELCGACGLAETWGPDGLAEDWGLDDFAEGVGADGLAAEPSVSAGSRMLSASWMADRAVSVGSFIFFGVFAMTVVASL